MAAERKMEADAARLDAWVAQALVRGQGGMAAELPPLPDAGRHIIERNREVMQFKRDQQLMAIAQRAAQRDQRIRLAQDRCAFVRLVALTALLPYCPAS